METTSPPGGGSKAVRLLRNRSWLLGAVLLGVAILFQLGSLAFAPLMVVQPIGVTALVFTVAFTSIAAHTRPSRAMVVAIAICVLGIALFVGVAARVTVQHAIGTTQLVALLVTLAAVLVVVLVLWSTARVRPMPSIAWVLLGGICSAFVATLGKTVILRVQALLHSHEVVFDLTTLLTLGCLVGVALAGGMSVYLVQRAHAVNRPEVVVAGLTVVDPAVAVVLAILILGEASSAPGWAFVAFLVAGGAAVAGVFMLSRAEGAAAPVESA